MESVEPTPGPWVWVTEDGEMHLEASDGTVVLDVAMLRDTGPRPHDEELIRAAPELLAMLERLVEYVSDDDTVPPVYFEANALCKRVRGIP